MLDVAVTASDDWPDTIDWDDVLATAVDAAFAVTSFAAIGRSERVIEVAVRLSDDTEVHRLNAEWRGKDKPTNVLSFPQLDGDELAEISSGMATGSGPEGMAELLLGDIILAYQTCAREAVEKAVPVVTHATHLVVHGTLHLLGYDHIDGDEALAMEALERLVMAELGHDDPYAADGVKQDGE